MMPITPFDEGVAGFFAKIGRDKKLWRQYRVLEVWCAGCNRLAAEVVNTPYGLAAVYQSHRPPASSLGFIGLRHNTIRGKGKTVALLVFDNQAGLYVFCRCTRRELRGADLLEPIRQQRRRVALPAP
jgi:hypothetical protein